MVFEGFLWSRGRVENDKNLNEDYGHGVDLKLKRELGKNEYYSCDSGPLFASFAIPIDLEDLRNLKLAYPKEVMARRIVGAKKAGDVWVGGKEVESKLSPAEIRKSCCREAWVQTDLGRLRLLDWQVKSIIRKYPGKCGKCGYSRFCYLEVVRYSIGSEATLRCPYCGKKTKMNWWERW